MILGIIYLSLLVLGVFFPKSKAISCLAIVFSFVVFSFVDFQGDIQVYTDNYNTLASSTLLHHYEPLFALLMVIVRTLGLPFTAVRVVVAVLYLSVEYQTVKKMTEYHAIAIILLMIFPMIFFASVMRSCTATAFVLLGMQTLIRQTRNSRLHYAVWICLAGLCHYSSFFFILYLFVDLNKEIDYTRFFWFFIVSMVIAVLLNTDVLYRLVSRFISRGKTLEWFEKGNQQNLTGIMVAVLMYGATAYLSLKACNICHSQEACFLLKKEQITGSMYTYNISMIMFLCLPLFVFAPPFQRLAYMMMPLCFCSWMNAVKVLRENWTRPHTLPLYGVASMLSIFVWRIYIDLPYIKDGAIPFAELISTKFVF